MENEIIQYLDEIVTNEDTIGIEIIYNYSLWLFPISYTNYKAHAIKSNKFKSLFRSIILRSLRIKYDNITNDLFKKKFDHFVNFEISFGKCGLHPYEEVLYKLTLNKLHDFLYQNTCQRIMNLDELDKKIINFLFNMISKAMENKDSFSFSEYGFNPEKHMLKVNTNDWATQFNYSMDERLKLNVDRFTSIFIHGGGMLGPNEKSQVVNFWEMYDRLLKLGIGYYIPWITKAGKTFMHFKIFKKLYQERENLFVFLEDIPNIKEIAEASQNISEKEDLKKSWNDEFF